MGQAVLTAFTNWFNAPFRQPMDVPRLFFAVGTVIVIAVLWGRILQHIHE